MECLIAGFDSFLYRGVFYHPNPAARVAELLDGRVVGGCRVRGVVVEVSREGVERVAEMLGEFGAAVGLGLYTPGSEHIRVEVAAVDAVGDGGYEGSWSVARIPVDPVAVAEAASRWWPARPSLSTGLYYCNLLAYTLYTWSSRGGGPSAFLHLPWSTELADRLGSVRGRAAPLWALAGAVGEVVRLLASYARRG